MIGRGKVINGFLTTGTEQFIGDFIIFYHTRTKMEPGILVFAKMNCVKVHIFLMII